MTDIEQQLHEKDLIIADLAMLVRRLVMAMEKHSDPSRLPERAMDYLKRKNLAGSPLR